MDVTRREVLTGACAAGAAALLGGCSQQIAPAQRVSLWGGRPRPFSFVHLTDQHVTDRRHGAEGYRTCIASINALRPRPAFVLMGGDLAFDGCYNEKEDFARWIRLYQEISDELEMPYYNCMGNHDVLGWSSRRKVPVDDPDLGKKMIMDMLGWERSYYSFDHGGWHFVVLDSTYPRETDEGPSQEPRIGPEQLDWLAYDLGAAAGRPTIAVVHVAAFCNMEQINGDPKSKAIGGMALSDTKDLRKILERHGVKLLLQGHSHRIEDYRFNGVWYVSSAAGGGAWWAGSWVGSPPGYSVIRCDRDDFTLRHCSFAWEPQLDPQDDLERRKIAEQEADCAEQQHLLEMERAGIHAPPTQPASCPEGAAAGQPSTATAPASQANGLAY